MQRTLHGKILIGRDKLMVELTETTIDLALVLASVTHPDCGAEVLFVGTTRQWTNAQRLTATPAPGQADQPESPASDLTRPANPDQAAKVETAFLIYESYREMALKQLQDLEQQARQRWPLREVAIVHRLGKVLPTQPSVAVAVSSPHRSEAFEAAKWLIDTLKHQVPIWKQEHYVQSGPEWIHPTSGNCRCDAHFAPDELPPPDRVAEQVHPS